jgi:hypothetical protein
VGWAGDAMLPIANYLYVLQSFGVGGHQQVDITLVLLWTDN